ncbi:hypothetical protein [Paraburkholderia nemoris]|uniref:hypothetical protein n=1 Tax=Paraburkholderia nemoris TaxID=2793076 RepID=UPI001B160ED8|nr:hypothetical protein [Paraburkholderia nemoris]CAE6839599.1 hypothetical protein LMG22931_07186 [Paraburkholderia nemoris]
MTSFLDVYLTEYDESLAPDSYIDPVGTLVIWSSFSRMVFRNRVNSVSNDVRNYTLNLFHHFLVRKLIEDDEAVLSPSLKRRYQDKDVLAFKHACLIFLENLFVYSLLRRESSNKDVKTGGTLGISNARRRWEKEDGNPVLVFTHEPKGQILVRQLGLGVSGRYKTPLIEMDFFDASYQYNKPKFQPKWREAEAFVTGDRKSLLGRLEALLYPFLKRCVAELHHVGTLRFNDDVPSKLIDAYANAFASSQVTGNYARDFWLQQTELNQGAAGALYTVLNRNAEADLEPKQVLEEALGEELAQEEKEKLERIARLEPFLSDFMLLFTLMAAERNHSIDNVAKHWDEHGRDANRLSELAKPLSDFAHLPAIRGSQAANRLTKLQQVADAGDVAQQIRRLADYHSDIMRSRGQPAWLVVSENDKIHVNARTMSRPVSGTWQPGDWYNQYYLPQFRSLVLGLQGVAT